MIWKIFLLIFQRAARTVNRLDGLQNALDWSASLLSKSLVILFILYILASIILPFVLVLVFH